MTLQQLDKHLSRVAAKIPENANLEAEAVFKAIISYMDGLAARKAGGYLDVQK